MRLLKLEQCRKLNKVTFVLVLTFTLSFYVISQSYTTRNMHPEKDLAGQEQVLLKLPQCNCEKIVHRAPLRDPAHVPKNGTCSSQAFARGAGQKVIGFTFFEPVKEENATEDKSRRQYFNGLIENVSLIKAKYGHDWIVRVYYQVSKSSPVMTKLCDLACHEPNVDLCNAEDNPRLGDATLLYPLIWRFLPVIDVNVDLYFSRDLDSRISDREVAAVNEFLESDKAVHVMRDHPAHSTYILGGTWGAKVDQTRSSFMTAFKKMFKDGIAYVPREKGGGYDQIAILRYVWPWAKKVALSHDSYTCHKFSNTSPFPTQRQPGVGNFIGSVVSLNQSVGFDVRWTCPEKCRPKNHQDWIYC